MSEGSIAIPSRAIPALPAGFQLLINRRFSARPGDQVVIQSAEGQIALWSLLVPNTAGHDAGVSILGRVEKWEISPSAR